MKKTKLLLNPLAVAVAIALPISVPTFAAPQLEEVIVTAQKREQNLQEVPIAITAFSPAQLEAAGASTIIDIEKSTPNAQLRASRGTNSTLTAFIRGIGQQDPLWGFEPGVGVYLDDVYIARPQGAVMDLMDLERLEILRGPQGTLYGKNTIGGAIKYITKKMTGEHSGSVKVAVGTAGQNDIKVANQIPLIEDELYFGFAVGILKRDGFGTQYKDYDPADQTFNRTEENYNKDVKAARASVEYSPTDSLFIRVAADALEDTSNSRCGSRFADNTVAGPNGEFFGPRESVYDSECGMTEEQEVLSRGVSLTVQYDITDELSSKFVLANRSGSTKTFIDFDGTPLDSFDIPAFYNDEQTTAEVQINYTMDSLAIVGGLFYYDGTATGAFDALFGHFSGAILDGSAFSNGVNGEVDTESTGAYVNVNWSFTDSLTLTAGGRYTRDEKSALAQRFFIVTANSIPGTTSQGSALTHGLAQYDTLVATRTDFDKNDMNDSWNEFSPTIKLDYKLNDETLVYVSYSEGFKSGGFDMRTDAVVEPNAVEGFDPETVVTYETGLKTQLFDNRLRLNLGLFYTDYTDMQVTVQSPAPAPSFFSSTVVNAGEATIQGLELEATFQATESWTINMALGLLDAEFDTVDETVPTGAVNGDGDPVLTVINRANDNTVNGVFYEAWGMQNAPDMNFQLATSYNLDIGSSGSLQFNIAYSFRDDVRMFEATESIIDQESYDLIDASVVWKSPEESWTAILSGKNLADEEYRTGGYNFPATAGEDAILGYYGDPRTITLTLGYEY